MHSIRSNARCPVCANMMTHALTNTFHFDYIYSTNQIGLTELAFALVFANGDVSFVFANVLLSIRARVNLAQDQAHIIYTKAYALCAAGHD